MVKAVKDKGGLFLLQLWHVGRASHTGQYCTSASPSPPHTAASSVFLSLFSCLCPACNPTTLQLAELSSVRFPAGFLMKPTHNIAVCG